MNISTSIHATREVHDYLLSAVNEGEKMCKNFVNSALSVGHDARKCLVSVHLAKVDFRFVIPTIPPEPLESFMMVFSVPISLQIPLKLPHVCLMENSPFSKADFISAGSSDQTIET
jgi:hypothetical protein